MRHGETGGIEQGGREIDETDEFVEGATAVEPGAAQRRGHADGRIMAGAFVFAIAGLEVVAVVGREKNNGVVQLTEAAEGIE